MPYEISKNDYVKEDDYEKHELSSLHITGVHDSKLLYAF